MTTPSCRVERLVVRSAPEARKIFTLAVGEWLGEFGGGEIGVDDPRRGIHGLIWFGAPWNGAGGALCRHLRVWADPMTFRGRLRCASKPRVRGHVRLVGQDDARQVLTVVGHTDGPAGRVGRVVSDSRDWHPTAHAWLERVADVLAARLERGMATEPIGRGAPEVMRMPLPDGVRPKRV